MPREGGGGREASQIEPERTMLIRREGFLMGKAPCRGELPREEKKLNYKEKDFAGGGK